jgi:hypothetical protein
MKPIKVTLIVFVFSFFVNTISAQQTVILNKKSSRTEDNTSIKFKFEVDAITSSAQLETLRSKMAASVVANAIVTAAPIVDGKSTFVVSFKRKEFKSEYFQNALIAAGLNDVVVDGEKIKTVDLTAKYAKK